MNSGVCLASGEPLPSWSRSDRRTCSMGCRTRLCRDRKAARNTYATGSAVQVGRSTGERPITPLQPVIALDDGPQP